MGYLLARHGEGNLLEFLTDIVDRYVLNSILVHLLGEVDRDTKEVGYLSADGIWRYSRSVWAASISSSRLWNHPNDPV
jgi:hypothetical protein